jgi:flagellar protein FliS
MNHYAAARAAYNETNVLTATPDRLVVMLYDGAIRYQAIIDELNRSLDMRQGPIARNLRDLYSFCSRHLIESTLNGNPAGYEEVAKLLAELREAWDQCALEPAGA